MTRKAKITSKGQITVPHEIRRALGVRAGDTLLFVQKGAEVRVRPVRAKSPFEKYRGIGNPQIPADRRGLILWVRKMRGHDHRD